MKRTFIDHKEKQHRRYSIRFTGKRLGRKWDPKELATKKAIKIAEWLHESYITCAREGGVEYNLASEKEDYEEFIEALGDPVKKHMGRLELPEIAQYYPPVLYGCKQKESCKKMAIRYCDPVCLIVTADGSGELENRGGWNFVYDVNLRKLSGEFELYLGGDEKSELTEIRNHLEKICKECEERN